MSNALSKILLSVIALMLVANPVIACCLDMQFENQVSVSQDNQPPCHSVIDTTDVPVDLSNPCADCGDCASSMSSANHLEQIAINKSHSHDDEFALAEIKVIQVATRLNVVATRTFYWHRPVAAVTPVSLKQKLSI